MSNVSSSNSQAELVPKLRFPEFQGEWITEKLYDFAERVTRKNKDNMTELPLTISSKDGLVDQVTYFNKKVSSKDMSGYYLLENGEFAYNKSYSVGYDFGSIKRLDRYPMGALSTLYICFKLKKYNSDFIKIYFDSLKWYKEISLIAAEGARNHGLLNIPTDGFFNTKHIIPQNALEQQKIAAFLTLVNKRIEKQQQLVNALKSYKRGLLSTIIKRYSIGRKLSEIADYRSSANTLSMIEEKNQGLYPVYDANGICGYSHTCDITTNYIAIIKDGSGVGRLQSCKGMSSTIGTLGAIIPVNCSAEYLYAALSLVDFKPFITGMAIPHIYFKDYRKIEIPFPNGKIRSDIATLSTLFDEHILASINVMNELTKQKHSLFQELFI